MRNPPKYLSVSDTEPFATFRPVGAFTLNEAVDMIDEALEFCRIHGINGILVNILGVTGFPSPSIAERFALACKWAQTADSQLSLAMVAPKSMVDQQKIGVKIARNRGLRADVFTDERSAVRWLVSSDDQIS